MFGESESESPRVPSPWDSLMAASSPPSPSPKPITARRSHTPSPLAHELIPRLVPESDDGNVEYKLQLLNPSPARFTRLVTQMKWRLLEGGGQAYYELGVADSGDLIGLPREELEQSLETLEMMAGEIGASVIVVKEIEVPAAIATLTKRSGEWTGKTKRVAVENGTPSSFEGGYSTTETETESCTDEDMSMTVVFDRGTSSGGPSSGDEASSAMFSMDPDDEDSTIDERQSLATPSSNQNLNQQNSRFCVDLEIASVFKPRPMKARIHNHPHYAHMMGGKNKRAKKPRFVPSNLKGEQAENAVAGDGQPPTKMDKAQYRRQGRDRRREEKRKALEARAAQVVDGEAASEPVGEDVLVPVESSATNAAAADDLVNGLETLHVGVIEAPIPITATPETPSFSLDVDLEDVELEGDDDVFGSPKITLPSIPTFSASSAAESHLDVEGLLVNAIRADGDSTTKDVKEETRLIVEALVVRKMSIEEAFLDFGGFSLT